MQLESLQIFCDVVRWASFSRGAAENGISQSSASQAVHQLEVRLGVKLIDRSKRPLVLTPHGKIYYEGCKDLVGRYQELENRVKALMDESKVAGTVGVASIYSVGLHHMARFVKRFEERYPEAHVRLEYLHPTRIVERVSTGGADLGLISYPKKWPELTVIPWRDEEMVLVIPPAHRFAQRDSVNVRELAGEDFVSFDPDLSIRKAINRFLRQHDVDVQIVYEFDNIENLKRAVEVAEGISILPRPTLAKEIQTGSLVAIRIEADDPHFRLTRPLAIIHKRHHNLDPTATRFLEMLRDDDSSVSATHSESANSPQADRQFAAARA
jgi:DNA-binding transcriptional LysR family regulator